MNSARTGILVHYLVTFAPRLIIKLLLIPVSKNHVLSYGNCNGYLALERTLRLARLNIASQHPRVIIDHHSYSMHCWCDPGVTDELAYRRRYGSGLASRANRPGPARRRAGGELNFRAAAADRFEPWEPEQDRGGPGRSLVGSCAVRARSGVRSRAELCAGERGGIHARQAPCPGLCVWRTTGDDTRRQSHAGLCAMAERERKHWASVFAWLFIYFTSRSISAAHIQWLLHTSSGLP